MNPSRLDVDRLNAAIGTEYPRHHPDLPDEAVRAVDIRGYAEAIHDDNPLWRDSAFAAATLWEGLIAPPGFVEAFAPNYRDYHFAEGIEALGQVLPFPFPFPDAAEPQMVLLREGIAIRRPIRPGDVVVGRSTVADVVVKRRERGSMVVVKFEKTYKTSGGEDLAVVEWDVAAVETAVGGRADSSSRSPRAAPRVRRKAGLSSGLDERDVPSEGDRLPRLTQPISITMLIKWSAVLWDMGIPHFDADYCRRVYGLDAPLAHGPLLAALHRRAVTDWLGSAGYVVSHEVRFHRPVVVGDVVTVDTEITRVSSRPSVELAVASMMTNQHGQVVSSGTGQCGMTAQGLQRRRGGGP
jgi:acyl dehydratase